MQMLRITMPDQSKWDVPVLLIAQDRAKYYATEFDGDVDRSLSEDTMPLFDSDEYEIEDWAANNMNWADVKDQAKIVEEESETDYQEGWVNGHKEIIVKDYESISTGMFPVPNSSNVAECGWSDDTLAVKFNSGATYHYLDVPIVEFEAIMNAESFGKYLNKEIKPKFKFEKQ